MFIIPCFFYQDRFAKVGGRRFSKRIPGNKKLQYFSLVAPEEKELLRFRYYNPST